jgi:hypothetical protein
MSRVLAGHFKTYLVALEKMVSPVAGPGDVLGVTEAASTGVTGGVNSMMSLFGKTAGRGTNTVRDVLMHFFVACCQQLFAFVKLLLLVP